MPRPPGIDEAVERVIDRMIQRLQVTREDIAAFLHFGEPVVLGLPELLPPSDPDDAEPAP